MNELVQVFLVAKREVSNVVRKKSFWISILAIPGIIIFTSGISFYSASQADAYLEEQLNFTNKEIGIVDNSNLIDTAILPETFTIYSEIDEAIVDFENDKLALVLHYPAGISVTDTENKIEIYVSSKLTENTFALSFNPNTLIDSSVLKKLDAQTQQLLGADISYITNFYDFGNGEYIDNPFLKLIAPALGLVFYFIALVSSVGFLLSSVAEEKESRTMEIILSTMKSSQFIAGKIIGTTVIILIQITILAVIALIGLQLFGDQLSIDLNQVELDFGQLVVSIGYAAIGFLIMANIIIGVGSAFPSQKEAQNFNGIFVMISVLPLYFINLIIAQPDGTVAQILSYTPLASPLILLARNALGSLSTAEIIISGIWMLIQLGFSFWLAFKLFELGSLEYSSRISVRNLLPSFRSE